MVAEVGVPRRCASSIARPSSVRSRPESGRCLTGTVERAHGHGTALAWTRAARAGYASRNPEARSCLQAFPTAARRAAAPLEIGNRPSRLTRWRLPHPFGRARRRCRIRDDDVAEMTRYRGVGVPGDNVRADRPAVAARAPNQQNGTTILQRVGHRHEIRTPAETRPGVLSSMGKRPLSSWPNSHVQDWLATTTLR